MRKITRTLVFCSLALLLVIGCSRTPNKPDAPGGVAEAENPLTHKLTSTKWIAEGIEASDCQISLGYLVHDGEVEPVAKISRGEVSAADAMVFHGIVDTNGEIVSEEVAAVFEHAETGDSIYAQARHAKTADCSIRFRIVLAGQPDAIVKEIALGD